VNLIQKDGQFFAVLLTEDGTEQSIALGTADQAEAEKRCHDAKLEEIESAARAKILSAEAISRLLVKSAPKLREALEEYLAYMNEESSLAAGSLVVKGLALKRWVRESGLGAKQVNLLEPKDINNYINRPGKPKYSTRKITLSHISGFLDYCNRKGYIFHNPCKLARIDHVALTHEQKEKRRIRLFTDDEVRKLLACTVGFWHACIALAYYTGLRFSDIVRLEWACLNEPGKIVLWTQKTNTRVEIPLPLAATRALEHINKADDIYVFPGERLDYISRDRKFDYYFKQACRDAGLSDWKSRHFHALRHTYLTRMKQSGINLSQLAKLAGHSHTDTTQIYLHEPEQR